MAIDEQALAADLDYLKKGMDKVQGSMERLAVLEEQAGESKKKHSRQDSHIERLYELNREVSNNLAVWQQNASEVVTSIKVNVAEINANTRNNTKSSDRWAGTLFSIGGSLVVAGIVAMVVSIKVVGG